MKSTVKILGVNKGPLGRVLNVQQVGEDKGATLLPAGIHAQIPVASVASFDFDDDEAEYEIELRKKK